MHITAQHLAARLHGWRAASGPLHGRLAEAVRALTESGSLALGSQLPSERTLAAALTVSRNTVTAAYAQLREDGWLAGRQGAAPRIGSASRIAAERMPGDPLTALFDEGAATAIDLTAAAPAAAPAVVAAFADPATLLADPAILTGGTGYHPAGHPALVAAITGTLRRAGIPAQAEQIVVTSGAQQGLALTATALRRARRPIAIEALSYPGLIDAVRRGARGQLVTLPVTAAGLDAAVAARLITATAPSAAFITNFQNPTGARVSPAAAQRLLSAAQSTGTVLVEDRTLADLAFSDRQPPPLSALAADGAVITIGSMSKLFWGGLRVGWVHANATLAQYLRAQRIAFDLGSPAPIQLLAAALLDRQYEATWRWRQHRLRTSLAALTQAIDDAGLGWQYQRPAGGPSLWVALPAPGGAGRYSAIAERCGVRVVPGAAFAVTPGLGDDALRIPFFRPAGDLSVAVENLSAAWRQHVTDARRPSRGTRRSP